MIANYARIRGIIDQLMEVNIDLFRTEARR
jgi:hypothetical protein